MKRTIVHNFANGVVKEFYYHEIEIHEMLCLENFD